MSRIETGLRIEYFSEYMHKYLLLTLILAIAPTAYAGMETPGSDSYNCPGNGHNASFGPFRENDQCSDECQNLVFDCAQHKLMVNGQPKEVDGETWLGCASNTGTEKGDASADHKIKMPKEGACGNGEAGRLPASEPKLESEPLPCEACKIHRMTKGAETKGCLGLEAKLFDFVYKKCGGCSYKIVPLGGGGGGGGNGGATGASVSGGGANR